MRGFDRKSRSRALTYESSIEVIDTDTLTTITGVRLPTSLAASALVVMPRPSPPAGLSAVVDGSRVTLQWTPGAGPGLATGFKLAAGLTSGSSQVVVDLGESSSLVVEAVPPGTYFVRLHGTNFEGASDPSNEVVVNVP